MVVAEGKTDKTDGIKGEQEEKRGDGEEKGKGRKSHKIRMLRKWKMEKIKCKGSKRCCLLRRRRRRRRKVRWLNQEESREEE